MHKDLILLHGALGSAKQFSKLEESLKNNFTIHKLDFQSHGDNSVNSDDFGINQFANDLKKFIDDKNLVKPFVFGFSMGGYVAMYLESISPGTFDKIFTLGTKYKWDSETSAKEAAMLDADLMQEKFPDYANYLDKLHFGIGWKELMKLTVEMMLNLGAIPILTNELISKIEIPCRISIGDKDKMVTLEETVSVFKTLQKGSLLVFPETQHPFERVNNVRLNFELISFFV